MKMLLKILISLLIVTVVTLGSAWIFGPDSAGSAFLVICIILGGYLGAGWGGNQVRKTDEYRQAWLSRRKAAGKAPDEDLPKQDGSQ